MGQSLFYLEWNGNSNNTVYLSLKGMSAHELHVSDSQATLKQHASNSRVRYARVCEWFASRRRLSGIML